MDNVRGLGLFVLAHQLRHSGIPKMSSDVTINNLICICLCQVVKKIKFSVFCRKKKFITHITVTSPTEVAGYLNFIFRKYYQTFHHNLLITKLHYINYKNYTDGMHGSKLCFIPTRKYNDLNEKWGWSSNEPPWWCGTKVILWLMAEICDPMSASEKSKVIVEGARYCNRSW